MRWFVVMKRQRAQAAHRARHACAAVSADTDAFAESTQLPSEPPAQSPSPGRVTPQKPDEALRSQASVSIERCARPGRTPWRAWLSCIVVNWLWQHMEQRAPRVVLADDAPLGGSIGQKSLKLLN